MESTAIQTATLAAAGADISFLDLFLKADIVVKSVMIGLLLASVWAWTIIFEKYTTMRRLTKRAQLFEETFWSGGSLEKLYERVAKKTSDPMIAVFVAGMREWQSAAGAAAHGLAASAIQRVDRVMQNTIARELEQIEKRMTFLASLGSAAPFIGLFGTVWGIMRSFIGIAATSNTSLAVVAPGIAEALLATGIGLVAAIPAVLAYNKFSTDINRYGSRLDVFSSDFIAILARNVDDSNVPSATAPAHVMPMPDQSNRRFGT